MLTSILFVCLGAILGGVNAFTTIESQQPTNGLNKGFWGAVEMCADLTFATSFQIRTDGFTSSAYTAKTSDNVGATGLRFFCTGDTVGITSSFDSEGTWFGLRSCSSSLKVMIGLQLNVKPNNLKTFDDELGVEDVRVACQDGSIVDGFTGTITYDQEITKMMQEHDEKTGPAVAVESFHPRKVYQSKRFDLDPQLNENYFGAMTYCSAGLYICGLQTRVDPTDAFDDNAGLTDLIFLCCQ